jgi:hypothetical protein
VAVRNRSGRPQRRRRKIGAMKRRRMNTAMRWKEEREMLQSGFSSGSSQSCTDCAATQLVQAVAPEVGEYFPAPQEAQVPPTGPAFPAVQLELV